MPEPIHVRGVGFADIDIVAHHRAAMFSDMGRTTPEMVESLEAATRAYLRLALPAGEYVGWLASPEDEPDHIVSGAGVQLRYVLPFPWNRADGSSFVASGSQAVVINVYTEPEFRRRGYARRLMQEVLEWARLVKLESLVLHAAADGRALYEQLGFVPTTEMRFNGELFTGPPGRRT